MSTPCWNGYRNRFRRFLCWCSMTYFFVFILDSSCEPIITPKYTEALTGGRVEFNCSAKFNICELHHLEVNGHSHQKVFKDGIVYRTYKDRFNVEPDSGGNSILSISNVAKEDAGTYTCFENSVANRTNSQTASELVVYEMSLSMSYHGISASSVVWKTADGVILNSSESEVGGFVNSALRINYDESNSYSYISQVNYRVNSFTAESNHMWSVQRQSLPSPTTTAWSKMIEKNEQKPDFAVAFCIALVVAIILVILNVVTCILLKPNRQKCREWLTIYGCLAVPVEGNPQAGIQMEERDPMQTAGSSAQRDTE